MSELCQYRNFFGEPGTGAHAVRVLDLAVVDVVGTIAIGWGIAKLAGWAPWKTISVAFLLGILFHRLFCVRTTLDRLLF
jgi:hypothetical protein